MRTIDVVQGAFGKFIGIVAALRGPPEFTCGECERWERCGLVPGPNCIMRAAQMSGLADGRSEPTAFPRFYL